MIKRVFENQRAVLFFSLLALIALALLSSSLGSITFRPAQPVIRVGKDGSDAVNIELHELLRQITEIPLWENVTFLLLLSAIILLIGYMLSPEMRKRLLAIALRTAAFIFIFMYVIENNPKLLENLLAPLEVQSGIAAPFTSAENTAPPTFEPPRISSTLSFLITFGIILVALSGLWLVYRWMSSQRAQTNPNPLGEIAKVARESLREMRAAGGFSQDKIIKCYEDMSRAVDERRGLYRDYAMTAAEFALRLENAGLPREPINRLTRLFESARYGGKTSQPRDVDEAVACLTEILHYCGETA